MFLYGVYNYSLGHPKIIFKKVVFSYFFLYILVNKKEERQKENSRPTEWPFFGPHGGQETLHHLRIDNS